ncbi:hypothetical protein SAMN05443661_11756 [Natronobacterium gregoryi]|uniref:Uncharacterized protein n=2 Tax=Natronobacterium gregoryi TaxID=44930 RepID=L0ADN3_NATGS|nr:hypothetical protein Natgr_0776 [Natronobacterium gregoryi SP2]SFJ20077.1 hypothetical protein SAMN05443661_11756 [Natronobacterium gregoryi]
MPLPQYPIDMDARRGPETTGPGTNDDRTGGAEHGI